MAKIVKVEEEKKENKKLNIDLSELKKIGTAILTFVASNPDLISKLLEKPASYLKKIVKGEDVSKDTKKKVNNVIDENKSDGIMSILSSLSSLSKGDAETTNIFGSLTSTLSNAEKSGVDVGSLLGSVGSLLGSNTKKTTKKSSNSDGLMGLLKGFFK